MLSERASVERGGNCALTVADEEVEHNGVLVLGPTDLASRAARTASQMLSHNLLTLLDHLLDGDHLVLDPDDEITAAMMVATDGAVVGEEVRARLQADARASGGT